jgi:hypothetical protein
MTWRNWIACAAAVVSISCGGKKEPAAPPPPKARPAPVETALTPVSAPADVFAVLRFKNPARLVDAGMRWATLPFDWRTLLARELPGADQVLDLSAPIDVAAMIDPTAGMEPSAFLAVSVGISSTDAALSFFQERGEVVKRSQRLIRLGDRVTCVAERSLGQARARLVCGSDADAVAALAPYMTRGLPTEELSAADVHARVLARPFQQRYGMHAALLKTAGVPFLLRRVALDHPRFDRALRDVLYGGAEELLALFEDLDRLSLDISLTEDQSSLNASATASFRATRSTFAQGLQAEADRVAPPSQSFWMLPSEASAASHIIRFDRTRFKSLTRSLAALADGWLDFIEVPAAQRTPLVEALERALAAEAAVSYATLPGVPAALATGGKRTRAAELADTMRHELGTTLLAIDGEATPYQELLSAATRALADRKTRARLETLADLPAGALPTARERAARGGKDLPRGTRVYEVTVPLDPLIREEPRTGATVAVVVAVVPDGERSWIGLSADEAGLYEHLAASRGGTPAATLQGREDLAALRAGSAAAAGFVTLRGLMGASDSPLAAWLDGSRRRRWLSSHQMSLLPHQGETPMIWSLTPRAQGPEATLSIEVPRQVLQDVAAAVASGVGKSSRP